MIQAHVLDAWTRPTDQGTAVFRNLTVVSGFAAPLFLWLAGVATVLAGERQIRQGGDRRSACQRLARRGLEVFVLAFVFRLQAFLFNPGGDVIAIFRVDILNIMGLSLLAAGLLWGMTASRTWQVTLFALLATAVAMATPVVQIAGWVDTLPTWVQWYLRPAGEHTIFTLFPWAGFVFAGSAVAALVAAAPERRAEHRLQALLAAGGAAILGLGLYTASLPTIYRQSSLWTSSPTFFAARCGILLLASAALHALAVMAARSRVECRPLQRLGRDSLFVYWIHVQLVYGWATWPLHNRLRLWQSLVAFAIFSSLMYSLIPVKDRLFELWKARPAEPQAPTIASA